MKKLSPVILADLVASKRKEKSMTQQALAEATGINRALISRIEKQDFIPSIPQLEQLGEVLGFEPDSVFADTAHDRLSSPSPLRIAVAGTGYVGLSIATLLAQHNHVTAVDILPEKSTSSTGANPRFRMITLKNISPKKISISPPP